MEDTEKYRKLINIFVLLLVIFIFFSVHSKPRWCKVFGAFSTFSLHLIQRILHLIPYLVTL